MSIATDLQNVYENLDSALNDCNEALVEKGITGFGNSVWDVGHGIRKVKDGRDLVSLIERDLLSFVAPSDLRTVGNYAFSENTSLTSVDFSACSFLILNHYAFYNCENLSTVILPNEVEVTAYGNYVFSDCTSLVEISFPIRTSMGGYIFKNCTNLEKVNFSEGLTAVGIGTFQNCSKINNIVLPTTCIASIYGATFENCSNLDTLVLKSNTKINLISTSAFTNTPIASGTGYIYVPSALLSEYQSATNWATYSSQFRAIEDYPDIVGG